MKTKILITLTLLSLLTTVQATRIPTIPQDKDITILDEYKGTINNTHPYYYGNYCYYPMQPTFFIQKGGVHNHAYKYTNWNMTPHITAIRNALFNPIRNIVTVYPNNTFITFSNETTTKISNHKCPLCNHTMHAAEFSPQSKAIYWFCDEDRLIIGTILK